MTSSKGKRRISVTEDVGESIERWQAGTSLRKDDELEGGLIGPLFNSLTELLGLIIIDIRSRSSLPQHFQSLESSTAALFFWGSDLNVSSGELDEAVNESPHLRDTCLLILISIGQFITSFRLLSSKDRQDEILHSTSIIAFLEKAMNVLDQHQNPANRPELDEEALCRTLRFKIDNLVMLGPSLASPARECYDDQEAPIFEYVKEHRPEQPFINSVAQRFPHAQSAIVTRLGRLNWERYEHMLQLQRTALQQDIETETVEKARTIFHDSGLGSSAPAGSKFGLNKSTDTSSPYAPSVISSRAEASHKRLPPLPPEGRSGLPFMCTICNKMVRYHRTKAWKNHVFDDILAYACPFAGCSITGAFFQDRDAMMEHLEQNHDMDASVHKVTCPLCVEFSSKDRDALSLHFSRHMEEIALAILPSGVDSDHDSDNDTPSEAETMAPIDDTLPPGALLQQLSSSLWDAPADSDYVNLGRALVGDIIAPHTEVLSSQPHPIVDRFGATRLARESEKGDLDGVKNAYNDCPEDLSRPDYAGITPLQKAALHGWGDVVQFLIDKGCDIACESGDGDTPLIDAVENSHLEVIRTLLEANVDPHHTNSKGQRALDVLDPEDLDAEEIEKLLKKAMQGSDGRREEKKSRQAKSSSRLLYNEYNVETLVEKAGSGDISAVGELLNSNIKPNIAAAVAAAKEGHYDVVSVLLAAGLKADPSPSKHPQTPIIAAIEGGHLKIVELLLAQDGFDPTRRDKDGRTYYDIAEEKKAGRDWKRIRELLENEFTQYQAQYQRPRRT